MGAPTNLQTPMVLAFTFPIDDWQFWVVSVIALSALAYIFRGALPRRWRRKKTKGQRVNLTISGKAADRK